MAGFKTHITVSTLAGVGYGATAFAFYDVPAPACFLAGGLCSVSGMFPDIDSGPGIPLRESLAFAAAVVSTMLAERFQSLEWSVDSIILAGALVYLTIRFAVGELLKRYTVHRGMFHSIPAAIIFGEMAYLLAGGTLPIRLYKAGGVVLGYMIHLVLDEMYSVYYVRGRMQIKKSFGTAIKLFGDKLWPNVSAYAKLALFTFLAIKDQAWMEQFYHQRVEARAGQFTQKLVEYSGKALGAKPAEQDRADDEEPTLGEVAQRALTSLSSSKETASPTRSRSSTSTSDQPTRDRGGAGQGSDPNRPWLPRWASGRDWLRPKPNPAPAADGVLR